MWSVIVLLCFYGLVSLGWAGPASPDPVMIKQPDGTAFIAYIKGDEISNWVETDTGYTVIENKSTRYWEYATKGADGTLIPSGLVVKPCGPLPNVEKHLTPAPAKRL